MVLKTVNHILWISTKETERNDWVWGQVQAGAAQLDLPPDATCGTPATALFPQAKHSHVPPSVPHNPFCKAGSEGHAGHSQDHKEGEMWVDQDA